MANAKHMFGVVAEADSDEIIKIAEQERLSTREQKSNYLG